MRKHEDVLLNSATGLPISGGTVTVRVANASPGTGALASIYSDNGITLIGGSVVTTSAVGRFNFYAPDGRYDLTFAGTGFSSYIVSDVEIADVQSVPEFRADVYGAKVDGSTDDTTPVQAAIDAASAAGGGTVIIPGGTCIVRALTGASNVHIRGVGKYVTILKLKASTNADLLSFTTKLQWQLSDLTLDGNGTNQSATSHVLKIDNTTGNDPKYQISRLYVINGHDDGINIVAGSRGAGHWSDVTCYFNNGNGVSAGAYDNKWIGLDVGQSGLRGIFITASSQHFDSAKSWFSGRITAASGHGFENQTGISKTQCVNCESQDNQASGFFLKGFNLMFDNCFANSNSQRGSGLEDGFFLSDLTYSRITGSANAAADLNTYQARAVNFSGASTNNIVALNAANHVTGLVGGTPDGNDVTVVNSDGTTSMYRMGSNTRFGSSAASTGIIGVPNNSAISGRNNANSGDVALVKVRTDDGVELGPGYITAFSTAVTPGADNTRTTGSTAQRWSNVYTVKSTKRTANAGEWVQDQISESITLSTGGTTTDSAANLLPANSIIEAVVARITTTITTATDWKLGDATQAARFTAANATLVSGTTTVGLNHADPTVATANLGPVQVAAAKLRITTTGTPGAGVIRVTVFYRQFIAPTS